MSDESGKESTHHSGLTVFAQRHLALEQIIPLKRYFRAIEAVEKVGGKVEVIEVVAAKDKAAAKKGKAREARIADKAAKSAKKA